MPYVVRFDEDRAPDSVRLALLDSDWQEYDEEDVEAEASPSRRQRRQQLWSVWWRVGRFRPSEVGKARWPQQRVNHIAGSWELSQKDRLARHIRRMRGMFGSVCDFAPESYILPNDYVKFCKRYAEVRDALPPGKIAPIWICKPSNQSQGRKIFLFRKLEELTYDERSVVQRYIDRPLLIGGYKFDLRIYVLVARCDPLTAFIYTDGFARFGTLKYDSGGRCLDSQFSHLTNSSINQVSPFFSVDKSAIGEGCKWSLRRVAAHFDALREGLWAAVWERIRCVVRLTLLSVAFAETSFGSGVGNESFELFGFDVLIDANLKPWLLEVNSSPQLALDGTCVDRSVKHALVTDTVASLNIDPLPELSDESSDDGAADSQPRGSGASATRALHDQHPARTPPAHRRNPAGRRGSRSGVRDYIKGAASARPSAANRGPQPRGQFEQLLPFADTATRHEASLRRAVAELRVLEEEAARFCSACGCSGRAQPLSRAAGAVPRPPSAGVARAPQQPASTPPGEGPEGAEGAHARRRRVTYPGAAMADPAGARPAGVASEAWQRLAAGRRGQAMTAQQVADMLRRFGIERGARVGSAGATRPKQQPRPAQPPSGAAARPRAANGAVAAERP
eukprot:TRINITY_DN2187_c1_g1_i1.p1 TRINITY_DN2187_c1_g1~~TRINITY_DN2187_c1_g1_i1.p1  ORF type:complete len:622 (+),score=171.69 TRINITY_DN2187_c1_g1_i1:65-1930(+)